MKVMRFTPLTLGLCLVTLALAGCGQNPAADDSKDALRVTVSKPLTDTIPSYDYYTGYTRAKESVLMRARVSGYLDKLFFKEGDKVQAGDKLFEIDRRPYAAAYEKAQADVTSAKSQAKAAEYEMARQSDLLVRKATSKSDYDVAIGNAGVTAAAIKAREADLKTAKINLDFTVITSPITGRIGLYNITQGNLVKADDTVLTTVVSIDPMYAYFPVDENSLLRVKQLIREGKFKGVNEGAKVPVEVQLANQTGYPYKGVLNFADVEVDPGTGTLQVRGAFDNQDGFLSPGLFCRVRISIGEPTKKFLVTERALLTLQGKKYLLVVDKANVVQSLPVTVGTLVNGLRVIESGLTGDERVIINGIQLVRPGLTVDPVPGKMQHEPGQDAAK